MFENKLTLDDKKETTRILGASEEVRKNEDELKLNWKSLEMFISSHL